MLVPQETSSDWREGLMDGKIDEWTNRDIKRKEKKEEERRTKNNYHLHHYHPKMLFNHQRQTQR
jgi:hypothetical protein